MFCFVEYTFWLLVAASIKEFCTHSLTFVGIFSDHFVCFNNFFEYICDCSGFMPSTIDLLLQTSCVVHFLNLIFQVSELQKRTCLPLSHLDGKYSM